MFIFFGTLYLSHIFGMRTDSQPSSTMLLFLGTQKYTVYEKICTYILGRAYAVGAPARDWRTAKTQVNNNKSVSPHSKNATPYEKKGH